MTLYTIRLIAFVLVHRFRDWFFCSAKSFQLKKKETEERTEQHRYSSTRRTWNRSSWNTIAFREIWSLGYQFYSVVSLELNKRHYGQCAFVTILFLMIFHFNLPNTNIHFLVNSFCLFSKGIWKHSILKN